MAIRLEALRRVAARNGRVFRVRRRSWDTPKVLDTDGEDGKPWTWERCFAQYFSRQEYALADAAESDWRGRGYVDQEHAGSVLSRYQALYRAAGEELTEYDENGRLRVLREDITIRNW